VGSAGAGDDRSICRAIIALANGLNLRVIAEGVETAEQLQYLRSLGCDAIQGYFFARPMDAADVTAFLCNHRKQGVAMLPRAEFSQ
jgi:EAL domain-containing protein (putative c-di-GMP-specific phosphodiesterase class I)